MLIVVAVPGFNESKTGERAVGQIGVVSRYWRNVVGIDAKRVRGIAHSARRLSGSGAGSAGRILVQVTQRISQSRKSGCRERRAAARVTCRTECLTYGVIDLPRNIGLVQFLKDGGDVELGKVVITAGIFDQALRCAAGESSDAVIDAFAGDWREPAV